MKSLAWDVLGEPVKTLVEAVTSCSASGLNVPGSTAECVKAELVSDLRSCHGSWEILLVSEYKEDSFAEFLF